MRLVRNILSAISFILAFPFLVMFVITFSGEIEGRGLAIGMTIFFIVLGLVLKTKSQSRVNYEAERERQGILETTNVHHLEGLPIADKTKCLVTLYEDRLTIDGGGVNFNLSIQQITAMEIKTDIEIANIVSSSATKGIAGGLLFGPIGLVVGSRATNKEKKTMHYYFIINYINSSGEVAAMMFVDDMTTHLTRKIVNKLKPRLETQQIASVQL